ncbi:Poly(3-hydroxyalkanoate) polymerase subunit PhaC [compost metagenome]
MRPTAKTVGGFQVSVMSKKKSLLSQQAAENTLNLNPVVGPQGRDILGTTQKLLRHAISSPFTSAGHAISLGRELKNVLLGRSQLQPEAGDRRFGDPAWAQSPLFRRYMQVYLAWRGEMDEWLDSAGLSEQELSRGKFVVSLLTDALAPTNTLANPAALKRLLDTGGKSLLDGLGNLARDLVSNGGMPSQVDKSAFEVGGNLATTEGAVVFRNEALELIQYQPTTELVHERPLLVIPPQINKYYVFDLTPEKSLVRYAVGSGLQTFVVSWRNPTTAQREWGLSTYIEALKEAVDAVLAITGSDDLNLLGACSGAITMVTLLGHYAALGEHKVNAFTQMVSVLDWEMDGDVTLFADEKSLEAARRRSYQAGVLEGRDMARVFAWMRPNDLIWNYWVNNYLLGKEPPAFDILYWNNDTTRLPAALHGELVDMFKSNPLSRANALEVAGTPIDLSRVTQDFYCLAGLTDHITPWEACYRSARLLGGKCEFVLSSSGHIQSILNPPGNPKARFVTGAELVENPLDWKAGASAHGGSWWPHWQAWLTERSGASKKAPRKPGNRAFPALEPAPGRYVR